MPKKILGASFGWATWSLQLRGGQKTRELHLVGPPGPCNFGCQKMIGCSPKTDANLKCKYKTQSIQSDMQQGDKTPLGVGLERQLAVPSQKMNSTNLSAKHLSSMITFGATKAYLRSPCPCQKTLRDITTSNNGVYIACGPQFRLRRGRRKSFGSAIGCPSTCGLAQSSSCDKLLARIALQRALDVPSVAGSLAVPSPKASPKHGPQRRTQTPPRMHANE